VAELLCSCRSWWMPYAAPLSSLPLNSHDGRTSGLSSTRQVCVHRCAHLKRCTHVITLKVVIVVYTLMHCPIHEWVAHGQHLLSSALSRLRS
jgi:hypothetical protein